MSVGRRDSNTSQQYINRSEPRIEPSLAPTSGGARPLANPGAVPLEASKTAKATEGDLVCRQYISIPHQGQAVSSPPVATRAGPPTKCSSEQLSKTETRHHTAFQQRWKPAETEWRNSHVCQEQHWKNKQRDQTVNRARGDFVEGSRTRVPKGRRKHQRGHHRN